MNFEMCVIFGICILLLMLVISVCLLIYVVFIYFVSVYNRMSEQKKKLKRMGEFNV